jgi:hypothetical protein
VLLADNHEFLEHARRTLRFDSVGSVLADPNGWLYRTPEGAGCPVTEMIEFFARHRRMDLIANLNLRFYKQMRGAQKNHALHPVYPNLYGLRELPALFQKRHGLISNRSHNGHSTFVRLILRNIPTGDWPALGWYQLDSPQAMEIYRYAETSAAERSETNGQMDLALEEPA